MVACGGGSAIDAGKAIAALLGNGGDPLDYLEVVGRGQPLTKPSLPFVAIPTTAGTGSEVTRNAVLASPEHRVKASLRSPLMLPRAALVDPDLLRGLPPHVVAASGLDAFAQLVEPFLSVRANPLVDALCREGLARSARSLRRAFEGDSSEAVRVDLALASLFGGLALANAGLGAVHGFAAPVGGLFDAPHGAACAALLPAVLRVNLEALSRRRPESPALARYREIAAIVTGRPDADAEDAVAVDGVARAGPRDPRPLTLGGDRGGHRASRREGARGQQHEGQPDRAGRGRARRDRAGFALARHGRPREADRDAPGAVRGGDAAPQRRVPLQPAAAEAQAGARLGPDLGPGLAVARAAGHLGEEREPAGRRATRTRARRRRSPSGRASCTPRRGGRGRR